MLCDVSYIMIWRKDSCSMEKSRETTPKSLFSAKIK